MGRQSLWGLKCPRGRHSRTGRPRSRCFTKDGIWSQSGGASGTGSKGRIFLRNWWNINDRFRAEVMGNLLGVCTNKQIRLLQDKLDERFPNERIDFSRQLPRKLSLHILKFLDPRSLSRCAQVSWYWKFLSESDELWRPKCLRFGWYPPYKPRYSNLSSRDNAVGSDWTSRFTG